MSIKIQCDLMHALTSSLCKSKVSDGGAHSRFTCQLLNCESSRKSFGCTIYNLAIDLLFLCLYIHNTNSDLIFRRQACESRKQTRTRQQLERCAIRQIIRYTIHSWIVVLVVCEAEWFYCHLNYQYDQFNQTKIIYKINSIERRTLPEI